MTIHLDGVIRNVRYSPQLTSRLREYDFSVFDINAAIGQGIVRVGANALGYSKWISPKRTRSYPYARIYDTYALAKRVTIIPVIKDEGANGDNDRINIMTLSLMNLLNVFVIFAWYDDARKHASREGKITGQQLSAEYVRDRLEEINSYQQTALHWNLMHFSRDFERVYRKAVASYQRIAQVIGIPVHAEREHLLFLDQFIHDGQFDADIFRQVSLTRSKQAAQREILTRHVREYLQEGDKATLSLTNYLGGEYHLTVDEVVKTDDHLILQESKNSTRHAIPSLNDMKDGLLKLILFSNIDELRLQGQPIPFGTRLKLTGHVLGSLQLPAHEDAIEAFVTANKLGKSAAQRLKLLNQEGIVNQLRIVVTGNQ